MNKQETFEKWLEENIIMQIKKCKWQQQINAIFELNEIHEKQKFVII